jgi:hypothetical protein
MTQTTTTVTEARAALAHWSQRAADLPWHRRSARREARMMISTSRAQLVAAYLELWGFGLLARILLPVLDTRGRSAGSHARSLALTSVRRTAIGRKMLVAAAGIVVASLACLALAAWLLAQLAF